MSWPFPSLQSRANASGFHTVRATRRLRPRVKLCLYGLLAALLTAGILLIFCPAPSMALVEDEHPLLMVQAMEGSRPSEVHNDETAALDAEALQLELNVTIDKEALKPVVIVPGLFGSQLEWKLSKSHRSPDEWCAKSTGHRFSPFWISAHRFLPLEVNCWLENNKLGHTASGLTVPHPGVETRPRDWPSVRGAEYLDAAPFLNYLADYAHNLVHVLRQLGYEDGSTMFAHTFDWRRSPRNYFESGAELDQLVELILAARARTGRRVVLVSHSMGSLLVAIALSYKTTPQWRRANIDRWVSTAGVFGGSSAMVGAMLNVKEFVLPPMSVEADFTPAVQTWGGVAWLAPNPDLLARPDAFLLKQGRTTYTLEDVEKLLIAAKLPAPAAVYSATRDIVGKGPRGCRPEVPTVIMYSSGVPTEVGYRLTHGSLGDRGQLRAKTATRQPGDGTVTADSAITLPRRWADEGNGGQCVMFDDMGSINHINLLRGKQAAKRIVKWMFKEL